MATSISKKDFKHAMELRDPDFTSAFDAYLESSLRACVSHEPRKVTVWCSIDTRDSVLVLCISVPQLVE